MKWIGHLGFVAVLGVVASCSDDIVGPINSPSQITLSYGQTVNIDGGQLAVSFTQVVHESRCPADVVCIWEGMAQIMLTLQAAGSQPITVVVGLTGNGNDTAAINRMSVDTLGYHISLRRLDPYPLNSENPIPNADYRATLFIEKSDGSLEFTPIIISDMHPRTIMIDWFQLDSASIAGDTLKLGITHGGGCRNHHYALYMSPSTFVGTDPREANLYLRHLGNGDACMALLTRQLLFSLIPIADMTPDTCGPSIDVLLKIFGYFEVAPTDSITLLYTPPDSIRCSGEREGTRNEIF